MEIMVNYWAVLVCGVVSMVLGGLWYGPIFGKAWIKEMGFANKTQEEMDAMKKKANTSYPQAFIGALLMAYVLGHVIVMSENFFHYSWIQTGLTSAFWMWLGFFVPVVYSGKLWGGKSFKLVALDGFYYLIQLLVFGAILGGWR